VGAVKSVTNTLSAYATNAIENNGDNSRVRAMPPIPKKNVRVIANGGRKTEINEIRLAKQLIENTD